MNLFGRASIKGKQTLIIMLTSGAALLLACLAFAAYEAVAFRHQMVEHLSIHAEVIGNNSTAALDFDDAKGAQETLSGLRADPNILGAVIYNRAGGVFAVYQRPGPRNDFQAPREPHIGYQFKAGALAMGRAIARKGDPAGTVYLESDLRPLYARLEQYALIAGAVFLASALAALLISARLQRVISGPILHLVHTMRAVTNGKNYSARAIKESEDELGALVDGFNEMLAEIQFRDGELQKGAELLEARVIERTRDLEQQVAERKRAEDELKDSRALYHSLVEHLPMSVFRKDLEGRLIFANSAFCKFKGLTLEELLGKTVADLLPARSAEQVLTEEREVLRSGKAIEIEEACHDLGSETRFFHTIRTPVRSADGQMAGLQGMFYEITDRKRAEEVLTQRSRLAALNAEIGVALIRSENLAEILGVCAKALVGHLDAAFARIWTLNPSENVLELRASAGMYTHLDGAHGRVPVGKFKIGLIAQEAKPHLTNTVVGDPRVGDQEWAKREGMVAFAGYPLIGSGPVAGVMALFARHELSDNTLQELGAIADGVALGIVRKQAEESLRLLSGAIEQSADNVIITDRKGVIKYANPAFFELTGFTREEVLGQTPRLLKSGHHEAAFYERLWKTILGGNSFRAEFTNRKKNGEKFCEEKMITPVTDSAGAITHFVTTGRDISARKRAENELATLNRQLLDTSRQAGMAEVATGVLHNVGNVLNSVNVTATLVEEQSKKSRAIDVERVAKLLKERAADLGAFVTSDPKGRIIPEFLDQLAERLTQERAEMLKDVAGLRKNVEHIKDIVSMQQSYARVSGVVEEVDLAELAEDTLRMNAGALDRHEVSVVREFIPLPPVATDKHKVLQILVNLVRNAKYACADSGRADRQITLRITNGDDRARISVIDNGVGIAADHLARIFNHGFTTRKDGHGFGLHSGALAAKELGGSLVVSSDGPGKGATFTLELPAHARGAGGRGTGRGAKS